MQGSSAADHSGVDGSHIEGIRIEGEDLDSAAGGDQVGAAAAADVLPYDAWHATFCTAFNMGSAVTRLQSLAIPDQQEATVRGATRAIYDTALEVPSLRWLIQPESKWLQRTVAIGAFAVPMANNVRLELVARRRGPAGRPANDNSAARPQGAARSGETAPTPPADAVADDWATQHAPKADPDPKQESPHGAQTQQQ